LPRDHQIIRHLRANANGLEQLVEQILLLYRLTPEHYQSTMEPVDVTEIARAVISEQYSTLSSKVQSIELVGEPCLITGDRFTLRVLLQNLLSNASKYTPLQGQIRVEVSETEEQVSVTVIDSGPGIKEADRERVLERFYRVGGDRHTSRNRGSGLGLSIVKLIVELYRAKIDFRTSPSGHGLAVEVLFDKAAPVSG